MAELIEDVYGLWIRDELHGWVLLDGPSDHCPDAEDREDRG